MNSIPIHFSLCSVIFMCLHVCVYFQANITLKKTLKFQSESNIHSILSVRWKFSSNYSLILYKDDIKISVYVSDGLTETMLQIFCVKAGGKNICYHKKAQRNESARASGPLRV